jgi:hypothetical protein
MMKAMEGKTQPSRKCLVLRASGNIPIGRRGLGGGEGKTQPSRKCLVLRASGEYANWQKGPCVCWVVWQEGHSALENPSF